MKRIGDKPLTDTEKNERRNEKLKQQGKTRYIVTSLDKNKERVKAYAKLLDEGEGH